MNVHLVSLGCVRNQVDSEEMLGRMRQAGWQITDAPETAHVIIVNTCSFIESAVDESVDTILELAKFKETGVCKSLIVAGCLPERYGEAIAAELPEVDAFLGTGAFDRIAEAAQGPLTQGKCLLPDPDAIAVSVPDAPRVREVSHMAYLKVAEGCSRHCTYCIIPRLRGKQKSRPMNHIVAEARSLIGAGARELILVAQDTTDYGRDLGEKQLAPLLEALSDLSGDIWLRVLYGHPESIDDAVIRIMAERPNICSYYDLPIQHASDPVLKKMGRRHPQQALYRLFEKIRSLDPEAVLRTTAIVGFPGETEADFEALLTFAEDIRFDHLGVFTYSDSEDLPSHRLPDHVPEAVAQERRDTLMEQQMALSARNNEKYLDRTLRVLIEESPEPNLYTGRTSFQAPEVDGLVYVHHTGTLAPGDVVPVRITDTLEYDLVGETE